MRTDISLTVMHTNSWQRRSRCAAIAAAALWRIAARTLVAAALLLSSAPAPAQQFTFRHYQQLQGLGNLSVTCLLQDRAGFVWLCTENGLFRHDGVGFERFGEAAGIDAATVQAAVEDAAGALWVGTSRDLYRRDRYGFKAIRPDGRHVAIAPGVQIAALESGRMLVVERGRLVELSASAPDGTWHSRPVFTRAQLDRTPALEHLSSVHADRFGRVWLGCGDAICRLERGAVDVFAVGAGVPADSWRSWLLDHAGRLWVRGVAHVVVLGAGMARFEVRDPVHARLTADISNVPIVEDPQGRVLTATDGGLARWQPDGWQEFGARNGVAGTGIAALLVSRDGQVWLGSRGQGLMRWLGYGHFESWTMAQGLAANPVWAIVPGADRSVVVATRGGCSRLDPAASLAAPCRFGDLPAGEIEAMAQGFGVLWLGMSSGSLFRVAPGESHAAWVANVPSMRKLYVDATGRLWIGSTSGVSVLELGAAHVEAMPLPAAAGAVTDVTQDEHGTVWLATQGGLLRWSGRAWIAPAVDGEPARAGFSAVAAAADGWLWAAGAAHGIVHLHIDGDRVTEARWVADPAVTHAAVSFISIDRRGWVWAGTDTGVVVSDGGVWRRFNTQDGLIWNDTRRNSVLTDADGSVWIGTSGGLTHIQSPEGLIQTTPIDLRITQAALGSVRYDAEPLRHAWEPNIAFNLHLAQLSYGRVGQSYLRVRLRGLGDEWLFTRNHDFHYPDLPPGRYTFEAVAVDPDRQQTSGLTQLGFEILPPWWQTPAFARAVAAAVAVLLAFAWIWRVRRRRARERELDREREERAALVVRATRDGLTGLWNRSAILEILEREIDSAKRHRTPLAVAIIDVDHFKRINDSRGHLAGDEVLRTLGRKLMSRVRSSDSLGRYGGEEFLLVVPGAPEQSPFLPLERLQRAIAEVPIAFAGAAINVTASFGVAWLVVATDTAESLLSRADAALYSAKDAGRNRVEYAATG